MRRLIKICGITNPKDALFCSRTGADRLGLIFAPSARQVTLAQGASIAESVSLMPMVGVFINPDPLFAAEAVAAANLSFVQVHDCTNPARLEQIATACERPVVPAVTVDQLDALDKLDSSLTLLLDLAKDPALRTPVHVNRLHQAAADLTQKGRTVILAGGLTPDNVAGAVRGARCLGVDVCGGVEQTPGLKNAAKVRQFITAVRHLEEIDVL